MSLFNYEYALEPRAANISLLLADEEQNRGNLARADEILERARTLAPQSWEVWRRSAKLALRLNRPSEAMTYARQAMRIHPSGITAGLFSEAADALAAATSQPSTKPSR
jgi:Tfp pilus assembly protein PilF